jgi:hypothetical protein
VDPAPTRKLKTIAPVALEQTADDFSEDWVQRFRRERQAGWKNLGHTVSMFRDIYITDQNLGKKTKTLLQEGNPVLECVKQIFYYPSNHIFHHSGIKHIGIKFICAGNNPNRE